MINQPESYEPDLCHNQAQGAKYLRNSKQETQMNSHFGPTDLLSREDFLSLAGNIKTEYLADIKRTGLPACDRPLKATKIWIQMLTAVLCHDQYLQRMIVNNRRRPGQWAVAHLKISRAWLLGI